MNTSSAIDQRHRRTRARLNELGFELGTAPTPIANFVPAVRIGELVYTSGQLPLKSGVLIQAGKLGAEVDTNLGQELAAVSVLNALAAAAAVCDLDAARVVRVMGYVASTANFSDQPAVINGASDLLVDVFGSRGHHARSAVGVTALPLNAPVEVELILSVVDEASADETV
ncbi:RidA family protein [Microbacterium sp. NPDC089696]|uniref:RidA family protein n=1 Tax=Microbacterium sp. NPDC089696 TaxID=3364199 RepID=UPI0037F2546E